MYRRGYEIRDQEACYYLTFQVVGWLDVFTRKRYRDIVVESFKYCQGHKGLKIYSWVIMSNHVHCILSSPSGNLSNTIRDSKRHTSKHIIASVENDIESRKEWLLHQFKYYASKHERNSKYQFWTHDNHPVELRGKLYDQRLNYIHNNPVKAGIVEKAEEYLYSSARDFSGIAGMKGLLKLSYSE